MREHAALVQDRHVVAVGDLVDEIADSDDVIVLHEGRVLAHGPVPRVVNDTGAADIRAAFTKLTGGAATQAEDEPS